MNEALPRLVLTTHFASTMFMAGVIWFVQVVHYPLFANVGEAEFAAYEQRHSHMTTWVVAPPMIIEAITAMLLFWLRPTGVSTWQLAIGLALVVVIWISTAFVQVPCHDFLCERYDAAVQQRLVATNWIRTVAWSVRGLMVMWLVVES